MSTTPPIPMIAPDGSFRWIPNDVASQAIHAGGKPAVRITDPQGVQRWIPQNVAHEALEHGGKLVPVQDYPKPPTPSAASRFLSSAVAPLKGMVAAFSGNPTEEEKKQGLTSVYDDFLRPVERVVEAQTGQVGEAEDLAKQGRYSEAAGHALASVVPLVGPWVADATQEYYRQLGEGNTAGAIGTAIGNTALAFAPKVTEKVVGPVARGLKEKVASARENFSSSPRTVRELVKTTQKENVGARQSNVDAATRHLNDTLDALHKTQGNELQHQAAMKAAEDAAAETQRALDAEHSEAVQRALQETREKEDLYQQELRKAKDESEAAYQKKLEEVEKKRADAERKRRQEARLYFERKAKVQSDFEAARDKFKSDTAKQEKIEPTRTKIKTAWGNLRAAVETAREKALKVGNEKYSTVNEKLNPIGADMETVIGGLGDAMDKIKGSDTEPSIIKDIDKKVQEGEALTYKDLQGYYSELNKELSKGTLAGDVYAAYDTLHDAIGNEMQRIADSQDMGQHLSDARNYWRRMKQTFGKPLTAGDVATQALKTSSPDIAAAEDQANRIRLLGSFDPRIPGLFEHIGNLQKGEESLPNPEPEHARLKSLVDARRPLPNPPKAPPPIADPEPVEPKSVAPPARVEIPDRPSPVQPKYPAPPERVAPPDRPVEVPEKKINSREIEAAKQERLTQAANRIRHWGTYLGFVWPAIEIIRTVTRGEMPNVESTAASMVATPLAADAIARIIESPKMKGLLTRATPKDIAQIPEDLRGDLPQIVKAAQSRGIVVSPAMAALVGAAGRPQGPKTQQLQKTADEYRNASQ